MSDQMSIGSPFGTFSSGFGQVCHALPQVLRTISITSISAFGAIPGAMRPPPRTS